MNDKDKQALFYKGAAAASDFLKAFDWDKYKQIRNENFLDNQNQLNTDPNNWGK